VERLEKGIELLSYASSLAREIRTTMQDSDVVAAVETVAQGAHIESIYVMSEGSGKRKRYIAHVTIEWSRCALTMVGFGLTVRTAILHAVQQREAQRRLDFVEPEDLPF
jgi:hypothetical protein